MREMRILSILAVLWFSVSGCAVVLVGAGAAGGYAIGKDYIQGETDKDFDRVYDSAVTIAGIMGDIESQFSNPSTGKIKANVETSSLEIYVERLTKKTVRLKVRSRKNLMPNIELAQKVYTKIIQNIR
ncbi:MAG: DUF3568 family protein [Candidatus Omnitrophota bacterium]